MKVNSLKEFKALIKTCRSLGVESFEADGCFVKLGALPVKQRNSPAIDQTSFPEASVKVPAYDGPITDVEPPKTEELTPDQLLYYSAQGHHAEDIQ